MKKSFDFFYFLLGIIQNFYYYYYFFAYNAEDICEKIIVTDPRGLICFVLTPEKLKLSLEKDQKSRSVPSCCIVLFGNAPTGQAFEATIKKAPELEALVLFLWSLLTCVCLYGIIFFTYSRSEADFACCRTFVGRKLRRLNDELACIYYGVDTFIKDILYSNSNLLYCEVYHLDCETA